MITVATVECSFGMVQFSPTARRMGARAEFYARKQREALDALGAGDQVDEEGKVRTHFIRDSLPVMRSREREDYFSVIDAIWRPRVDYHGTVRRKYERAARYPWLAVAPDPPEPQ